MGKPKVRYYLMERIDAREVEIREWAWVVELGLAFILVGLVTLLV